MSQIAVENMNKVRKQNRKRSQLDRVRDRIKETGSVDNFWAIDNYILRLGAIIHMLRKEGMFLEGYFGKELGKDTPLHKNYYYVLLKEHPGQQRLI